MCLQKRHGVALTVRSYSVCCKKQQENLGNSARLKMLKKADNGVPDQCLEADQRDTSCQAWWRPSTAGQMPHVIGGPLFGVSYAHQTRSIPSSINMTSSRSQLRVPHRLAITLSDLYVECIDLPALTSKLTERCLFRRSTFDSKLSHLSSSFRDTKTVAVAALRVVKSQRQNERRDKAFRFTSQS